MKFVVGRFGYFHLVVWSQFVFGSLPPPPQNQSFVVGRFGYFHLVVWSQFAFGSLPPPLPIIGIDHLSFKIFGNRKRKTISLQPAVKRFLVLKNVFCTL